MVNNSVALGITPPSFDISAPLVRAAQMRQMQAQEQATGLKMRQDALGAEARGLMQFANHPEFAQKWAQSVDKLASQGVLDPQTAEQYRRTPSPLLLKQIIASTESPEISMRREEAQRAQGNADRSFGLQERQLQALEAQRNAPVLGEVYDPNTGQPQKALISPRTGQHQPIGGVKTEKPRQMSVTDLTKLQEEGAKFSNLTGFSASFKDDYSQAVTGNMRNTLARNLPELMTSPEAREAATFWQGYDRFKNVVRNDLFGSALTATEQAAFEKADINPGMNPKSIRENLKIQQGLAETALKRKAAALGSEGYRPESISAAYGVKLEDLGVSTQRSGAAAAPKAAQGQQFQEGQTATNKQTGEKRVYRGGQWVPVQ
jgi:hypothetical protein